VAVWTHDASFRFLPTNGICGNAKWALWMAPAVRLFAVFRFLLCIEHMFDRVGSPNKAERWRAQCIWNS
jgi:hypothetical protein